MAHTRLVLIRHAHTESNGSGPGLRMSGWTDLPLTSLGWWQVERLAQRMRSGAEAFAALYASPLQRTRDTARAVVPVSLGPLQLEPLLREIHCGDFDGLPVEEVRRKAPELWEANLRQDDADFRWPGGESYRELRARSLAALHSLAARHPGQRVAVVTHAGVISQVLGALAGTSPARWEDFRPGNTALTEVAWSEEGGRCLSFDDRSHLCEVPAPIAVRS